MVHVRLPTSGILTTYGTVSLRVVELRYSVSTSGPYQTNPPCPGEIKNYVQEERKGLVTRIRHKNVIHVKENEILTREIITVMKSWVEIIRENIFSLGGNRDHVPACLCQMLYCIARPNAPSKTPSTKDTSSTFGTTSSSFESKTQSLPPTSNDSSSSSNDSPSPQPSDPFLDNIMDAPPRPSNPIPL
ncbi:hypothetical protein Tco_1340084 [Tanacetum coccineum]